MVINGGNYKFNTADDAIHTNASLAINGGEYEIQAGDDHVLCTQLLYGKTFAHRNGKRVHCKTDAKEKGVDDNVEHVFFLSYCG